MFEHRIFLNRKWCKVRSGIPDFGVKTGRVFQTLCDKMHQMTGVLTDKGSKYAVSSGVVKTRAEVDSFLKQLRRNKKYAKATHNTWAVLFSDGGGLKGDDGESGAGLVILRMLERDAVLDRIVVVTRWYGGVKLGGDRFRHVQTCVRAMLDEL
jgi:putative IMPACT (imprinted ancient) family translation regulator